MFDIDILATPGLGNRSYLASDGQVAIAIDPPRDIDRVLSLAGARGVRIALVVSTHSHNDMISGETELARLTGARLASPADDGAQYPRDGLADGDVLDAGRMRLRVLHTPGHTHHHVAYALQTSDGGTEAVFTGGSLLFGATGRTDLVGPEHTDTLTRAQFHSVRRLVAELPADATLYPTHGFGSFCAATPTSGDASTLGEQQQVNPALTLDEQTYVDTLLGGLDAYPAYYSQMSPVNRRGPAPVDLTAPEPVDAAELRRRIEAGEWVVDLRDRSAFAAGSPATTRDARPRSRSRRAPLMTISAPFLIDAVPTDDATWVGRVRVDGHVLFLCAEAPDEDGAVRAARACLATHLQMLFTGATDVEHQQQTERYGTLVEVEAAQVLRQASGWSLVLVRFHADHIITVFQRDWPSGS